MTLFEAFIIYEVIMLTIYAINNQKGRLGMSKCNRCEWEFCEDDHQIETFDNEILCSPCFIKKDNEDDEYLTERKVSQL